jgi:site-specific DNA-methyltransferase (adenine-specific)
MRKEAAEAGLYQPYMGEKYPRLQILSIAELLEGKKIDYPRFALDQTHRRAPKSRKAPEQQIPLGGEIEEPF